MPGLAKIPPGGEDGEFLDLGQIAIEARFTTGGGDSRRDLVAACHNSSHSPCTARYAPCRCCLLYGKRPEKFLHIGWDGAFEGQVFFRYRMPVTQVRSVEGLDLEFQSTNGK